MEKSSVSLNSRSSQTLLKAASPIFIARWYDFLRPSLTCTVSLKQYHSQLSPQESSMLLSWNGCVLYTSPKKFKVRDQFACFSLPAHSVVRDFDFVVSSCFP